MKSVFFTYKIIDQFEDFLAKISKNIFVNNLKIVQVKSN